MSDIIENIIPENEVSILAGASGAGKTTLLMEIVRCLQQNQPVFGHAIKENLKIGYIAADRTWDAYVRLAELVGVDISKLCVRALIDDQDIDVSLLERDPQQIMLHLLKQMAAEGCDLVIVDPLVVLLGADINTYHVVAARMIKLNRFCKLNKLTILGTHHATKARTDFSFKRPQDRISGTSALLGFTSTQLFLASAEESGEDYTQWHIVSHHAKAKIIYLERDQSTGLFIPVDQFNGLIEKQNQAYEGIFSMLPADGTPISLKSIITKLSPMSSKIVEEQVRLATSLNQLKQYKGGFYSLPPKNQGSEGE